MRPLRFESSRIRLGLLVYHPYLLLFL
jgi:hypothetical protein